MTSLFAQPLMLMKFKFSRRCNLPDPCQSPRFRLVITSSPIFLPWIHLMQLYQTNSLAPTNYFDAPEDQIRCVPSLNHDVVETFDPYPLRYLSIFRSCHGSLRTNKCFDLIALEISSFKSLSLDLLGLLRHFSVGYFEPAMQNSDWHRTNDYHSGRNDHS
jgi:hypothetical protein